MSYSTITGMRSARYPLQGSLGLHPAFRPTGLRKRTAFRPTALKERAGLVMPRFMARAPLDPQAGFRECKACLPLSGDCGCGCGGSGACGMGQERSPSGALPGVLFLGALAAGVLWMGAQSTKRRR